MKKSRIRSITILVLFHIMLIAAFVVDTGNREAAYMLLAIYVFLVCIWVINYRKTLRFRALWNAIAAEHKLNGRNVMIFQTGYIRMNITSYAAGIFTFKSHLQLSVNVPQGRDTQSTNDIIEAINKIIEKLQSEGLLISYQLHIDSNDDSNNDEDPSPQCVYPLRILMNETITPERLGLLYSSLYETMTANGSNDCEQFTITGTDSGTIYKHYRGNLCIGMIECGYDDRILFNTCFDRALYFGDEENEYSEKQYKALRDSIRNNGLNLTLEQAAKFFKQILKKTPKGIRVSLFKEDEKLSVSISGRNSSENIHLTRQDGLWWIYGYGNMIHVPVLSTESETEAVRMMARLITNVKNKLDNQ